MREALISNIQKYSIHDGGGIRTVVFFKGCSLSCRWCHNPENQCFHPALLYFAERCGACGVCALHCPSHCLKYDGRSLHIDRSLCTACGMCITWCSKNCFELAGKYYTARQLTEEIEKDRIFYDVSGGGVTLSGGEVMQQEPEFLLDLMKWLKRRGCHLAVDTCGYAPYERFDALLPYTDVFLYDIKLIDAGKHKYYTGVGNELILDNIKRLSKSGAAIQVRIPIIGGVNDNEKEIRQIAGFIRDNIQVIKINLLPYHNTGQNKYARLGKEYPGTGYYVPTAQQVEHFKEIFKCSGLPDVQIGG